MQVTLTNTLPITSPLFHKMEDSVCESVTDNQYSFTFQYLHCSYGSILQYTDLFPGMVRDFCNEFIDNRHIPQHQLPPLHKMGSSVCHSVSDNQSISVFHTRICTLRNIFTVCVCFLRKNIRNLCRYSYC